MLRRGQCRCGEILHFRKTSVGYKTKCPKCSAVVRLRGEGTGGPRALPASPTVVDAPEVEPADLPAFVENESSAPLALAEMEAYRPPEEPSALKWVLFALAAGLVVVGVGVAAMWWG